MSSKDLCGNCGSHLSSPRYISMKEWDIAGYLCGKCYSQKISEHYPGKHGKSNDETSKKYKGKN